MSVKEVNMSNALSTGLHYFAWR